MEYIPLELLLKLIFLGAEVLLNFSARKREKALITTLEKYDQRLVQLENKIKEIP